MRLLSLRWIVWAGLLRAMSEPDRIHLHIRGQLSRGPEWTVGTAGLVDVAVARDDLVEAEQLLDQVANSDPNRESLQAAVLLLAGHVTEAEDRARVALESKSSSGRRRARRVLRRAARIRRELFDGPAAPAPRRPVLVCRGSQIDSLRVLHVLKNSLPQVQAGYTIRTQEVIRAQQAAGINAQAVTRLGFPVAQGHLAARTEVVSGVRYHRLLAGNSWMAEYGDPDVAEEWAWISQYSPYQNVQSGVQYPKVFFTTSTRDDRVHPAHARKMVARMLEQGHKDVLYYENMEGGHGGAGF